MKSPASSFGLGSEFDDFLFAPIGEDRNGMSLRVVSLLGRMDLDPWQEAASLAALPTEAAVQRLVSLLAPLPGPPLQHPDPHSTAARLVALLPRRPDLNTRPLQASVSDPVATPTRVLSKRILIAIYLTVMLTTQFVIARLDLTRADANHTPPSVKAHSQTRPPAFVK